jgi:hypothetical protein
MLVHCHALCIAFGDVYDLSPQLLGIHRVIVKMSTPTGPRRGKQLRNEDHAVVLWDNGERTELRQSSSSAWCDTGISKAVASIDLFPKTLVSENPEIRSSSHRKSIAFLITMPLAAVGIILWFMLTPQLQNVSVPNPSYSDYLNILPYGPICTCRQQDLHYVSILNFTLPAVTDPEHNMCKPVRAMYTFCEQPDLPCFASEAASLFHILYLRSFAVLCLSIEVGAQALLDNIYSVPLGPTLLDPHALNDTIFTDVLDQVQKFVLQGVSLKAALPSVAGNTIVGTFDASYGSSNNYPVGCNCTSSAFTPGVKPSQLAVGEGFCTFQAAFDSQGYIPWTCSVAENLILFPLALFQTPQLYTLLGMPDASNHTSFALNANSTTFYAALTDVMGALNGFSQANQSTYTLAQLNTSLLQYSHAQYYRSCEPFECRYNYNAAPTLIAGLAVAFGVISGVQSVLMLTIDQTFDWLCKTKGKSNTKDVQQKTAEMVALNPLAAAGTQNAAQPIPTPLT